MTAQPVRTRTPRALLLVAAAAAALAVTWHLRPPAPSTTATATADVVRGCEWVAWALVAYLLATVGLAAAGQLAGRAASAHRAVRRLTPRRVREVVELATTVAVASSILGSVASASAARAASAAVAPIGRPAVAGALDWPGLRAAPDRPAPGRTPTVTVGPGDTLWGIAARHLAPDASAAEVTRAWHAWYAANRVEIGPDPSVIRPGERLHPPAPVRAKR